MVRAEQQSFITERARSLAPSPTIAVAKEAQRLRDLGVDVVDFGPGEPDFDTPPHVRAAAIAALEAGLTHYAPSRGLLELREAIADKLARENDLRYDPVTEIVVTPGAKQALVEVVLTSVGPGDEVIVFDPGWPSYDAIVRLAGGVPVHVDLTADFMMDRKQLTEAVGEHTRAIIVGSPQNPTGHVLTRGELDLLAEICRQHDLLLVSDEIYERITYDGATAVSPATLPRMWERTATVNGLSKAYAMTGWRLGYVAAPRPFMDELLKVHEHTVTAATTFAQVGGAVALRETQEPVRAMVAEFDRRRAMIVEALNGMPGVSCISPRGTFYAFPTVEGTGLSGTALAQRLLESGVAVTPGVGFGADWDAHIRISFAVSDERIETGMARMAEALRTV